MRPTVLITGASRGIGAATAMEFAKHGYDLVLVCKNNIEKLETIIKSATLFGVKCYMFAGDISKENIISELDHFLSSNDINIDILVNNAGISHIGLLQDMSIDEWNNVINTNLTSMFLTSKMVIPSMVKKQRGRIINISSIWGNVGASCEVAYSASKGGVNSFTKALSKELAPSNISVNAIAFGVIDTEMNQFLSEEDRQTLSDEIPFGRFATPKESAELIFNIATAPSYMTGQVITMDGGML